MCARTSKKGEGESRFGPSKSLEICYVMSDYRSLVYMKKEFFAVLPREAA